MLKALILAWITVLGGAMIMVTADEPAPPKPIQKARTEAVLKTTPTASPQDAVEPNEDESNDVGVAQLNEREPTPDELAIGLVDEAFIKAYEAGDANAVAACFTSDAEYMDETGTVLHGREAIARCLVDFFEDHSKCKLEMNVDSIRMLSPGVALEDGHTVMIHANDDCPVECRYTTVYVKVDEKWLAASIRDSVPRDLQEHSAQLRQLDWLIGEWVDEGNDAVVHFSCDSADNGNFLVRSFAIHVAGQPAMTGTQRIGWDPLSGKLRTWIFDSQGSFGEGFWYRRTDEQGDESWVLKTSGVMADGQTASSTSIYKFVNDQTMTWQSKDHEIGGVQQPDSEVMTIVRSAPVPVRTVADDGK